MSAHADRGLHSFRDEAKVRATLVWENTPGIERPHRTRAERRRTVVWATDRAVPIGVTTGGLQVVAP